jgi:hypothetical protein
METLAQIAGLAATGWVVWDRALAGRPDILSRIANGIVVSLEAWFWAAIAVLLLRLAIRHLSDLAAAPATRHAFTSGVWFAPATLLMMDWSVTAVTGAVVLAIGATRLLSVPSNQPEGHFSVAVLSAGELPIDLLADHFNAALLAAAGLQGALALGLMGRRMPAAALLLLSIAIVTALAIGLGAWTQRSAPNLPRSVLGLCLTVLLALAGGRIIRAYHSGSARGTGTEIGAAPPGPNLHLPGTFPGVVLWPTVRPVTVLIEPLPAGHGPPARLAHPLTIPFGGEYWMYRYPFRHPPPNSFVERGTPSVLSFSTPDMAPLNMEAHQKLDRPISLRCCRAIQLEIVNADTREADIRLVLLVARGSGPPPHVENLGVVGVKSQPEIRDGRTVPVRETLDFPIPLGLPFDQFDEFEVIFDRLTGLSHSARVAIERFVLVP